MALLFSDNFDSYTPTNNLVGNDGAPSSTGGWSQQGTYFGGGYYGASSLVTATGSGNSWWFYNGYLQKLGLTTSTNTIYASFWTRSRDAFPSLTSSWQDFYLLDGSTKQLTVSFCSDGAIRVYRGGGAGSGALIATFNGAVTGQTWAQWEIKAVIDDAAGSIEIRKNGATSNTYSATALDTKNTSNTYINGAGFGSNQSDYSYGSFIDNFQLWDSSGSSNNNWTGGGGSGGGTSSSCSALASGVLGTVRLYADGQLVFERQLVKSGEQFRLPSGFKAQFWQLEFEARVKVFSVQMATSAKELRGV